MGLELCAKQTEQVVPREARKTKQEQNQNHSCLSLLEMDPLYHRRRIDSGTPELGKPPR